MENKTQFMSLHHQHLLEPATKFGTWRNGINAENETNSWPNNHTVTLWVEFYAGGGSAHIKCGPTLRPGMDQAILSKERAESHMCPSPLSSRHSEQRDGTWNGNHKREGKPEANTTARISIAFKSKWVQVSRISILMNLGHGKARNPGKVLTSLTDFRIPT